jgi:cellulose biosynthesis protein BcsQ
MRVVAIAGAKGGVGKTAAAVNLSVVAAMAGYRTLLWDLDPQGAATHCYRAKAKVKGGATRLLGGKRDLQSFTRRSEYPNLDLLPADASFRVVDTVLSTRRWPERVIRKLLRPLDRSYDVVVLDCAPGLGVVTESIVAASDLVLAPIVPAPLAVRSLDQLADFVSDHRAGLQLLAFLSMLDERKVLHRQMQELVRTDRRFALSAVPVSSAVERMGLEQVPAVLASPRNLAASAYRGLWAEVDERLELGGAVPLDPSEFGLGDATEDVATGAVADAADGADGAVVETATEVVTVDSGVAPVEPPTVTTVAETVSVATAADAAVPDDAVSAVIAGLLASGAQPPEA